ncbi:MAG: formylglycine-generating enzyme family protein [Pseudomonadota bacterium]
MMSQVQTFRAIVLTVSTMLAVTLAPVDDRAQAEASPASCHADAGQRVFIPGGTFTMGAGALYREEGAPRPRRVADFWIDKYEVSNRQFREFVDATGYVSIVEQRPDPARTPNIPPELLSIGSAVFTPPDIDNPRGAWWTFVEGAYWAAPTGPGSNIDTRLDHPVTHIAFEDAQAYAAWVGGYLPDETQWEYAARGGLDGATYAWGNTPPNQTPRAANTWQGMFPVINTKQDGHDGSAPVGCFDANGYGLHDMIGNVWEWVQAEDDTDLQGRMKGGSYLCSDNFCRRYRPAARHAQEKYFSASHIGFRVAYDQPDD